MSREPSGKPECRGIRPPARSSRWLPFFSHQRRPAVTGHQVPHLGCLRAGGSVSLLAYVHCIPTGRGAGGRVPGVYLLGTLRVADTRLRRERPGARRDGRTRPLGRRAADRADAASPARRRQVQHCWRRSDRPSAWPGSAGRRANPHPGAANSNDRGEAAFRWPAGASPGGVHAHDQTSRRAVNCIAP